MFFIIRCEFWNVLMFHIITVLRLVKDVKQVGVRQIKLLNYSGLWLLTKFLHISINSNTKKIHIYQSLHLKEHENFILDSFILVILVITPNYSTHVIGNKKLIAHKQKWSRQQQHIQAKYRNQLITPLKL